MKIGLRFLSILAAAAWLVGLAPAQVPQTLTLKEAETIALSTHPRIQAASATALAAEKVITEVRSAYYPTTFGNITGVKTQTGTRLATPFLAASNVYDRYADGLLISQLVTDFGRTAKLSETAELQADAQREGIVVSRADVLLGLDQAYFRTMKAQAVLTVAEQTVRQRQVVADRVEALAKAKLKSGLDVTFAEVNLGQAKLLLVAAQNDLKAAFADLSLALGFPDQRQFILTEEPLPPTPPQEVEPLLREAFSQRPELVRQRFTAQSAHAFQLAERDLSFPTISSIANLGLIQIGNTSGKTKVFKSSYAAGGFNVAIPIFTGKLFSARRAEANSRARAEDGRLQDVENRVFREVRVAWLDALTAYQRLDLTAQILAQATQALELADARYRLGLSSIVELQQAQLNQTQAAIDQASAKYDYAARTAALDYAVGRLR
jgi:outer membrane protein